MLEWKDSLYDTPEIYQPIFLPFLRCIIMFNNCTRVQAGWWRGTVCEEATSLFPGFWEHLRWDLDSTTPGGICHWFQWGPEQKTVVLYTNQTQKDIYLPLSAVPELWTTFRFPELVLGEGGSGSSCPPGTESVQAAQQCWALLHKLSQTAFVSEELRGLGC